MFCLHLWRTGWRKKKWLLFLYPMYVCEGFGGWAVLAVALWLIWWKHWAQHISITMYLWIIFWHLCSELPRLWRNCIRRESQKHVSLAPGTFWWHWRRIFWFRIFFFNHGRHFATFLMRELPAVSLEFSPATSWLQAYLHIGMLSTLTTRSESTWCGSECVRRRGEGKVRRKKVRREKMKEGELTPVGWIQTPGQFQLKVSRKTEILLQWLCWLLCKWHFRKTLGSFPKPQNIPWAFVSVGGGESSVESVNICWELLCWEPGDSSPLPEGLRFTMLSMHAWGDWGPHPLSTAGAKFSAFLSFMVRLDLLKFCARFVNLKWHSSWSRLKSPEHTRRGGSDLTHLVGKEHPLVLQLPGTCWISFFDD